MPKVPTQTDADMIQELLVDQLRDILHAEKQFTKALPKMVEGGPLRAAAAAVRDASGGDRSPDRAAQGVLRLLGIQPRAKACKGMMGIVEEGEEVMAEGKKKDETAADLALIGAAQKVEHYEMSGYITARNLAQQLHMAPIVQLLQLSLGEEENADQLLNQLARPLMSVAKMPESVE